MAVRFVRSVEFQESVRARVDAYFASTGRRPRDSRILYLKSALLLLVFFGAWALLVFAATAWWQAVPLTIAIGFLAALIGLNIQHDGGHRAFSDRPWVNRLASLTLDLIGASSYLWHVKHSVLHHSYTNVVGQDTDIDVGFLGRMAPDQRRLPVHRWQHIYVWFLYGFMTLRWHLHKDWLELFTGRISNHRFPRPKGRNLVFLIAGKAVFLGLAFGVPMLLHAWWAVLLCYMLAGLVMGVFLSLIFQIAHCVDQADFPMPDETSGRIEKPWAVHQVESTVDFARDSRLAAWLLGGINYQIEHHLFPRVSHVHYPALSKIVETTCREFGVRYGEHKSVWAGVIEHYRFLRRLGAA